MKVTFTNQLQYDFVHEFLKKLQDSSFSVWPQPDTLSAEVSHEMVARLLARVGTGESTVLLNSGSKQDSWLIVGNHQHALEQSLSRVTKFIIPSYAEFSGGNAFPQRQLFDRSQNIIHQLGSQLYPTGYYELQSPVKNRPKIFNQLNLWLDLEVEAKKWALPTKEKYSYQDLYAIFESALAANNWPEAEKALHQMRQLHLSTAENLKFLRIQLWAKQHQWPKIWQDDDFELLVRLRLPRAVRSAMLTAFHYTQLLPVEQDEAWQKAFAVFGETRSRLGTLLTARLGLTQAPVVRVFAYQALFEGNQDGMKELLALDVDSETRHCLLELDKLLAPLPTPLPVPALERAKEALRQADYDLAIHWADQIETVIKKLIVLLEVAYYSNDAHTKNKASSLYNSLSAAQKQNLKTHSAFVERYSGPLKTTTASPTGDGIQTDAPPAINTWLEWVAQAEANPNNSQLSAAADYLQRVTDERYWTLENVTALNEHLLYFLVDDETLLARPDVKKVIEHLTTFFLKEPYFPRENKSYTELYELLLEAMWALKRVDETNSRMMLRLTEVILQRSPGRCSDFMEELQRWFSNQIPQLEHYAIDGFELLAESCPERSGRKGLEAGKLGKWYRECILSLLHSSTAHDRMSLEAWLDIGKSIEADEELLRELERLSTTVVEQESDHPVAALPAGYGIRIVTQRALSAERAKQLLLNRNAKLDIRICQEKVINREVESIAKHSDMAVIVAASLNYELTYGISGHLANNPAYPTSSGSTSIIRAIEDVTISNTSQNKEALSKHRANFKHIKQYIPREANPKLYRSAAYRLGACYYKLGRYREAYQALDQAHQALELLRGQTLHEGAKVDLTRENIRLYEMLVNTSLKMGERQKALEYAMAAQGRAFVDRLATTNIIPLLLEHDNSHFALRFKEATQLRQKIEDKHEKIENEKSASKREKLRQEQAELIDQESNVWQKMAQDHPVLTATQSVPSLSHEQAKQLAADLDATLVEFYRYDFNWNAFIITEHDVEHIGLHDLDDEFISDLTKWTRTIELPTKVGRGKLGFKRLEELHKALITPWQKYCSKNKPVILAPFGELHLLPLSAASQPGQHYFVDDYTLIFIPTLTALYVAYQQSQHSNQQLNTTAKQQNRFLSVAYPGQGDDYLQNVCQEAENLASRFKGFELLKNKAATAQEVIKKAKDKRIIHLSCHGKFDSKTPYKSGLELAGGMLTVQDIISKLNLNQAQLVTLAACSSGRAAIRKGEEHVGLLQAMMIAGAQTVVASLWRVDDEATRDLFDSFYDNIASGHPSATSMRKAAQKVRQTLGKKHPYYWAPFQVNGLGYQSIASGLIKQPNQNSQTIASTMQRGKGDKSMDLETIVNSAEFLVEEMKQYRSDLIPKLNQEEQNQVTIALDQLAQNMEAVEDASDLWDVSHKILCLVEEIPALREELMEEIPADPAIKQRFKSKNLKNVTQRVKQLDYVMQKKQQIANHLNDLRKDIRDAAYQPASKSNSTS